MATVKLVDISKYYDNKTKVVDNISLEIKDKEFMVLVGPSGCGKSTTLRMVAGLEEISAGELYIDDKKVNHLPPKERDIAMVFQNYALYPHMTVYENMAFGLKLRNINKKEIEERILMAANMLELKDYLQRKPSALSGGQRQRVAVGRAIVRNPKIFLFDEPLSNLDAKLRVQMRLQLNKLHKNLQTTMIYVTHDQVEAMTMGDRIAVMRNGKIEQCATPLEIYNHPLTKFVAGFIGSPAMNFIECEIIEDNNNFYLITDDFKLPAPQNLIPALKKNKLNNQKIILGIRPEDILITDSKNINELNNLSAYSFDAQIEILEFLGAEINCVIKIKKLNLTTRINKSNLEIKLGETYKFAFNPEKLKFFDISTEKSIL